VIFLLDQVLGLNPLRRSSFFCRGLAELSEIPISQGSYKPFWSSPWQGAGKGLPYS